MSFEDVTTDSSGNIYSVGNATGTSQFSFGNSVNLSGLFAGDNGFIIKYSGESALAPTPTPTPTLTPTAGTSNENSNAPSNSSTSAPTCGETKPSKIPDLFQVTTMGTSAALFYSPVNGNNSNYLISYSEKPNVFQHSLETNQGHSTGVLTYTIGHLKPNTTYYFKVRGQNGCMPGDFSSELFATTGSIKGETKSTYFKSSQINKISSPVRSTTKKASVPATETIVPSPTTNLLPPAPTVPPQQTPVAPLVPSKKCFLIWCW